MNKKNLIFPFLMVMCSTVMAQTASFKYFTYTGNDSRFDKTINRSKQYFNPILAGFYPDPSICRKGDTYYLVNSSFTFYPGVPIFTSKDLVSWKQMGYVLDRPAQLPLGHQDVSGGVFAPAISYNKKNQTFYMITTNVGMGNFYVKTKDPAKGWSDPIRLPKVGGIDPSFFFDENGNGYIVNNDEPVGGHDYEGQRSIMLHYFDVAGDSTTGKQIEVCRGGTNKEKKPIWIEGPHLFKNGRYYYLMCAEGGTGSWHSEVVLRSTKPDGPFEEFKEGNPILTQREGLDPNRADFVSSAGHADIVQTPKGDWWAVFLGARPYEQDFYNTGRDTYMLPVTWNNGWPTILEKNKVLPTIVNKSGISGNGDKYLTGNFSYRDNFNSDKLNLRWQFLRNPTEFYTLGTDGLTMKAKAINIYMKSSPSAIFTHQQHLNFTAETEVKFIPRSQKDFAGFVMLQNEKYNFVFGKTMQDGKPVVILTRAEKSNTTIATASLKSTDSTLKLKIVGKGRYYDFFYSEDGSTWQELAKGVDAINLSTSYSGGFIGACIGLYTTTNNM